MIGMQGEQTRPNVDRDRLEYSIYRVLMETRDGQREAGHEVSIRRLMALRDGFTVQIDENNQKIAPRMVNAAVDTPRISDFVRLLESTGATHYGRISTYMKEKDVTLEVAVRDYIVSASKEFEQLVSENRHPHVATDPEMRTIMYPFDGRMAPRSLMYSSENQSVRDLELGDYVSFDVDKEGSMTFETQIPFDGRLYRSADSFKSKAERTREAEEAARLAYDKALQKRRVKSEESLANRDNAFRIEPLDHIKNETFYGWTTPPARRGEDVTRKGLDSVLAPYLSKADIEIVRQQIGQDEAFSGELVERSAFVLRHLRSRGYDFNVIPSQKSDQIEVQIGTGQDRRIVRVMDKESNGMYIGNTKDAYNLYYYIHYKPTGKGKSFGNQEAKPLTDQEIVDMIDFAMGRKTAYVAKTKSSHLSSLYFPRTYTNGEVGFSSRELKVAPIGSNAKKYGMQTFTTFDSEVFKPVLHPDTREVEQTSEDVAKQYVEDAIRLARMNAYDRFRYEEIQALIDETLDTGGYMTSPETQARFEALYDEDDTIRSIQEDIVNLAIHSNDGGLNEVSSRISAMFGSYDEGFDPSIILEHMPRIENVNERQRLTAALKLLNYPQDLIKGDAFTTNALRENLIRFDPATAKGLTEVDNRIHQMALQETLNTLRASGVRHVDEETGEFAPDTEPLNVKIDANGIIRWEGYRPTKRKSARGKELTVSDYQKVSGEVGQIFAEDENGIVRTSFNSDNNFAIVPGYNGYFTFDNDDGDRMSRFRVKGYEQELVERVRGTVTNQLVRPYIKELENIPTALDATKINKLYRGELYGKRIDPDFMETNQLDMETKQAILKTLRKRVRFGNEYSEHATTFAETNEQRQLAKGEENNAFSYYKLVGNKNMRVLHPDLKNYADMTMTGTNKTQGLVWYLTEGTRVRPDGRVTPSKGMVVEVDGEKRLEVDKAPLQKLPYFKNAKANAWDRNQMASNQLMTATKIDKKVGVSLIPFGGWTFDDSYAVSKEFAERNKVMGSEANAESVSVLMQALEGLQNGQTIDEVRDTLKPTGMLWSESVLREGVVYLEQTMNAENDEVLGESSAQLETFLDTHGRFRPLQRGDKLSDFGGNKGTIGIVIDRDMPLEEARALKLEKEVAFYKANPSLDVVGAPYSMMSRHNAGVVHDLMDGGVEDLVDPETGRTLEGALGHTDIIVTDITVDSKTHAYSEEDVSNGLGRKASGQLAWALQSKGATHILDEIYGRNESAWSTYREYLIATGLDMGPDGTLKTTYVPHENEERRVFEVSKDMDAESFLNEIKDQGGFLEAPFPLKLGTGRKTTTLPILSASLRQNTELVDGSVRRNEFNVHYMTMYNQMQSFMSYQDMLNDATISATDRAAYEAKQLAAVESAQRAFDRIQNTIITRQFNGTTNGKHSFLREKIMGKRMANSATGVAIVDPRIDIGQAGMNRKMMESLGVKEGDTILGFRDPVWRDGAIRSFTVVHDETVHGVSINPIADKSHDMDFDGDTMGLLKLHSKAAVKELEEKFGHYNNMIDVATGNNELYFQTGMDLASAEHKALALGANEKVELREKAHALALQGEEMKKSGAPKKDTEKILKQSLELLNDYTHAMYRDYGFASDYVNLSSKEKVFESFQTIVDHKAKGSQSKLEEYHMYHNFEATEKEVLEVQRATGIKSDDTGLPGSYSQKFVSVGRNQNIKAGLEVMYLITQGTLQIKKDASHAAEVNDLLTNDLAQLFNGRNLYNPKEPLTKEAFKTQLYDTYTNRMKVDVNKEFIDDLADMLTDTNGEVMSLKEAMLRKGSAMDIVAYGGGFNALQELAVEGRSLAEGEMSKHFVPRSMRADLMPEEKLRKTLVKNDVKVSAKEKAVMVKQENETIEAEAKARIASRTVNAKGYQTAASFGQFGLYDTKVAPLDVDTMLAEEMEQVRLEREQAKVEAERVKASERDAYSESYDRIEQQKTEQVLKRQSELEAEELARIEALHAEELRQAEEEAKRINESYQASKRANEPSVSVQDNSKEQPTETKRATSFDEAVRLAGNKNASPMMDYSKSVEDASPKTETERAHANEGFTSHETVRRTPPVDAASTTETSMTDEEYMRHLHESAQPKTRKRQTETTDTELGVEVDLEVE